MISAASQITLNLMKYSLCVTHYNRAELLKQCFPSMVGVVDEIIIQDDASRPEEITKVMINHSDHARIIANTFNIGMSRNKAECVSNAENNWCILFDSDNIITPAYTAALPKTLDPTVIYCPAFARPDFDYRHIGGTINRNNIKQYLQLPRFEALLNTCNYVVNRKKYVETYEYNAEMKATDTIWFAYLWLRAGYSFQVVPGMEYFHRVHKESGFLADIDYNMKQAVKMKKLLLEL